MYVQVCIFGTYLYTFYVFIHLLLFYQICTFDGLLVNENT